MAAYVVIKEYHRLDFLRLRIDRRAWCLELADKLMARYPEEAGEWADYGRRAPAVLIPGFDADLPRGADLLGIGREVEAFAMLVAGRDTLTPLSIGLFGGWGTGKSYFMARLEERVAALSATDTSNAYFGRIAQVRFNAWHYSEANMIASLVDQILRNLRFGPDEDEEILRERRAQVMAEMTTAEDQRRRAERELESAATSETALRDALDRVKREADEEARRKAADLAATARAIEDAQSLLQQSFITEDEARAAALRRAPAAEAASFVARTMLEDEDIQRLSRGLTQARDDARWVGLNQMNIVWGVAAITLTVLAAFSVDSLKDTKLFTGLVGLVAAITPVAASWLTTLRTLSARGAEFQAAIRARAEAAVKKIEENAASERQRLEANIARQQAAATALKAQLGALETRTAEATAALAAGELQRRQASDALAAATADIAAKRAQLDAVTSGSLLEEAVAGLAAKEDYRRELGTIARARTDFERLSRRMTKARTEYESGKTSKRPVLDRLVLYIDDLDRCPADKVREVLRAVHLLLAFDLFVCVVAVDPRWVIQCLDESPEFAQKEKSAELEILGGVATASDYLEKIFQIPIWLRPVPASQRAPIAATLLGGPGRDQGQRGDVREAGNAAKKPSLEPDSTSAAVQSLAAAPERIQIVPQELEFLERVSPLLDGNVRALKRFVNTYRLVKASISDVELDYFTRQPYMVCLAQLAVLATQRTRAQMLVKRVDAAPKKSSVGEWLAALSKDSDEAARQLGEDLSTVLLPELGELRFGDFAVWFERTRRYSFYL